MGPGHLEAERLAALAAVRVAARLCRAVASGADLGVVDKADLSPVTVADFGSQALVCRALAAAFADDPVVGEEDAADLRRPEHAATLDAVRAAVRAAGVEVDDVPALIDRGGARAEGPRFWTLDPVDGTKGFLRREQYAIALALILDGRPAVGVLACPNLAGAGGRPGVVFSAVAGRGARAAPLDAEGDADERPVRVGDASDPAAARLCESVESGHSAHDASAAIARRLGLSAPPVRLDSQAKYAVVARGEADIYLRLPTRADYREKIWDHAAGALVVAEAGGAVTDVDGRPLDFAAGRRLESNRGVVVTNGPLHARVLEAVRAAGV